MDASPKRSLPNRISLPNETDVVQSIRTAASLSTKQHKATHQEENIAAHEQQEVSPAPVRHRSPWHGQPLVLVNREVEM